ncbi:MAG: hypothetical protein SPL52_02280 [Fibrobacter sp.]|nr:hypothetical protein [Fibrobacter sp.]
MKKIIMVMMAFLVGLAVAASDQTVMVSGSATEKKPANEAYEDALRNTLIAAVEKNLGTWLNSQSSSVSFSSPNEFAQAKHDILAKYEDFIVDYKVRKRGMSSKGFFEVTASVTVSTDRLAGELKKYVGALKSKMDNPSIAFVLTSWEKKGVFTTTVAKGKVSTKNSYSGSEQSEDYAYNESAQSGSARARASGTAYAERNVSGSGRVSASERGRIGADVNENSASYNGDYEASGSYEGSARGSVRASESVDASYAASSKSASRNASGRAVKGQNESTSSVDASLTTGKIDETMYAKFADMSIIDGFQQEFKEKGFDLKAADRAREIAIAPSAAQTGINISDRSAVRDLAEKEGANFVARGEVMLLGQEKSAATGQPEITAKIGTEIIDVNSGDVVASYSNTVTASNSNIDKAKSQVIKKAAVVAARTLASQTLQTWQERAESGRQYTVEIRNMTKARSQKIPFEKALKSIAKISSQTSPKTGVQTYQVLYKGNKSDLGMAIIEAIGDAKGFSESEFDGPNDENGKIVFTFTK